LAEFIDAGKLASITEISSVAWFQRLGYLLELIGEAELAEGLAEYVSSKDAVPPDTTSQRGASGYALAAVSKPELILSHSYNKAVVCSNCGSSLHHKGK
jgi:hypothetical protein